MSIYDKSIQRLKLKTRWLSSLGKDFQLTRGLRGKARFILRQLIQWLRMKAIMLSRQRRDLHSIMETIDTPQLEVLQEKYKTIPAGAGYKNKYLNINKFLPINLRRAYSLGLHNAAQPTSILDLGAGPGYFCHICNYFGHHAVALDLGDNPVYNDLISLLKINRKVWAIKAFERLPDFGAKFDLVTAFLVCFNENHDPDAVWRAAEWEFFLRDLANNLLTENGRVFLRLNSERDGKHYDQCLLDFFLQYEAQVYGCEVYFETMDRFRP